jgi:hypothetical protein
MDIGVPQRKRIWPYILKYVYSNIYYQKIVLDFLCIFSAGLLHSCMPLVSIVISGVWISFLRHSPNLRVETSIIARQV